MRIEEDKLNKVKVIAKGQSVSRTIESLVEKFIDAGGTEVKVKVPPKQTSVSLSIDTAKRLEDFSKKTGVSVAAIVRLAIEMGIQEESDTFAPRSISP
jgi:hypothetical protein